MDKPILFYFSNQPNMDNLFYLKDIGKVLDLSEAPIDLIQRYKEYDFICVNLKQEKQVDNLKYINISECISVAILRKYESIEEPWISRLQPEYKVKDFVFIKKLKSKDEIFNLLKFKNSFKKPDNNVLFLCKKVWALLSCLRGTT